MGAKVEIVQGHLSSTWVDGCGGPWTRTDSSTAFNDHGGVWYRTDPHTGTRETQHWHGLIRRWMDVHPYEKAQLVVVDEGPDAAACPACDLALVAHTERDSRECLLDLANRGRS